MDNDNINEFILKSIDYYDSQKLKYDYLINNKNIEFKNNDEIIFNNDDETINTTYEILGYFDRKTNIWIWGWVLNENTASTEISKNLLNYGLKLGPERQEIPEHFFIKSLLVNSRILIDDEIQLDINIAIYSYLLKGKFSFIYPKRIFNDSIVVFLLVR